MPIYEFRCPNGHVFEIFQRMDDPPPEVCETCGEGPLQRVLFPIAVHFKGSGFYSTDYGRSRKPARDSSEGGSSDSGGSGESKTSDSKPEKKSAEG